MLGFFKKSDYYHPLIIWLILLLWYLVFADKFFSGPRSTFDNFISEQAFWFFNQTPTEADDITIVAIDEASRRHLNLKWPWKRSVTAELIKDIASFSPKIIGIDIVFSGKSPEEEDRALMADRLQTSWHNNHGTEKLLPLLDKGFDSTKSDVLQEKMSENA